MNKSSQKINYRNDVSPDVRLISELYRKSLLNRPVDDLTRIKTMYDNSNIVLSAWNGETLVGILRGWSDGAYHGYICDLAIHPDYQRNGIGKNLLDQARAINPKVELVLRASVIASEYYKHISWEKIENGWFSSRKS